MGLLDFIEQRRSGGLLSGMFPEPQSFADAGPAVPDFPGGAGHWLGSNGSTPIGFGAGVAGGSSWGDGLSNGLPNALAGGALDPQRAGQSRTVTALMSHGLDEDTARAAAGNPTMLRAVLWQLHAPLERQPSSPDEQAPAPAGPQHLDSAKYWGALPMPSGESAPPPVGSFHLLPVPRPSSWDPVPKHVTTSAGQLFPGPSSPSPSAAPTAATDPAEDSPADEAALAQDAREAASARLARRERPAAAVERFGLRPPVLPPAPPVQHLDSASYWGAAPAPSGRSDQPSADGFYLSPLPRAPNWEQVVPTATPWSVHRELPSPTSWGNADPGMECYTSGGNLHCLMPGGRRVTVPAEGLPDGLRIAPGEPRYHYYSKPDGPVSFDPSALTQGLINRPTVGPRRFVRPATPEGTRNEATPGGYYHALSGGVTSPFDLLRPPLPLGTSVAPVMSYLTTDQNGTPMIVNVTQPGHGLRPGIVIRYVTTSPSGSTIQNEGTGLAPLQAPRSWAANPISSVWEGEARDIIREMQRGPGKPPSR